MGKADTRGADKGPCFDARETATHRSAVPVRGPARARTTRPKPGLAPAAQGGLAARAVRYLEAHRRKRGSGLASDLEYVADGVEHTPAGIRVVRLQQRFLGVPVYDARCSVHFNGAGRIQRVVGDVVGIPHAAPIEPVLPASEAVLAASKYLAARLSKTLKVAQQPPRMLCQFPSPERPTVLHKKPFRDPLTAHLSLLRTGGQTRLAWVVHLVLPSGRGAYEVVVCADRVERREVLLCRSTMACAVEGAVFRYDPREAREVVAFPLPRGEYPQLGGVVPPGFPWPWVDANASDGNNVRSYANNTNDPFEATVAGADARFEAAPAQGSDQRVVNAFYVCNFLHDFFQLLGFDEQAGNFQRTNRTGLGDGNDQLIVQCFSGNVEGFANMLSRKDGRSPELGLGSFQGRHTALDTDVVIHEFAHGVTNRMIGGLAHHDPLRGKQQSEALGEGYSDYFAVTIRNYYRRRAGLPPTWAFGAWIADNDVKGWRRQSYENGVFVGNYGDLKTGTLAEVHDAGQVWCRALLKANALVGAALGGGVPAETADELMWRIVVASLPLCRDVQPHFLDARDAILVAFDALDGQGAIPGGAAAVRAAIVDAFRQLGMGRLAASADASYAAIVADFT